MPLRLHHLLAAVLKKWKPQKVPRLPLSHLLPTITEQGKAGSLAQPTKVPGVCCHFCTVLGTKVLPPVLEDLTTLSSREGEMVSGEGYRMHQWLVAAQCGEV